MKPGLCALVIIACLYVVESTPPARVPRRSHGRALGNAVGSIDKGGLSSRRRRLLTNMTSSVSSSMKSSISSSVTSSMTTSVSSSKTSSMSSSVSSSLSSASLSSSSSVQMSVGLEVSHQSTTSVDVQITTSTSKKRKRKQKKEMSREECEMYSHQAPVPINCAKLKSTAEIRQQTEIIVTEAPAAVASPPPPPPRPASIATLVTIVYDISETGKRFVVDVVFKDKRDTLEEVKPHNPPAEALTLLQDHRSPSVTWVKLNSEFYRHIFGDEGFEYGAWFHVYQETVKGTATSLSPDYADLEVAVVVQDTGTGDAVLMVQLYWFGESPTKTNEDTPLYTLVSVDFRKEGGDPMLMLIDVYPDTGAGVVYHSKVSAVMMLIRKNNKVFLVHVTSTASTSKKVDIAYEAYEFVLENNLIGTAEEVNYICAFHPEHPSCRPPKPERPRGANVILTVVFNEDANQRKHVIDLVFLPKEILISLAGHLKLEAGDLEPLKQEGPTMIYVKLNSEIYKQIFGSDDFNYKAWLKAYKQQLTNPSTFPELKNIVVKHTDLDPHAGFLYLIQMFWNGPEATTSPEDTSPFYTLVAVMFPKDNSEPQTMLYDVYDDSKPGTVTSDCTKKLVMVGETPEEGAVMVTDLTPVPTVKSKINIQHFIFVNDPDLIGATEITSIRCAFNAEDPRCVSAPVEQPELPPPEQVQPQEPERGGRLEVGQTVNPAPQPPASVGPQSPVSVGPQPPTSLGSQPPAHAGPQPSAPMGPQSPGSVGPQPPTSVGPQPPTSIGPQPPTSVSPVPGPQPVPAPDVPAPMPVAPVEQMPLPKENNAKLVTIMYMVNTAGRKFITDVTFVDKKDVLKEIEKNPVDLRPEDLDLLNDPILPVVIYVKLDSPEYKEIFTDKFNIEPWMKLYNMIIKTSAGMSDFWERFEVELIETSGVTLAGVLFLIEVNWMPQDEPEPGKPLTTVVAVLFPLTGDPQVALIDIYPTHPPTEGYTIRQQIVRTDLKVTIIEILVVTTVVTTWRREEYVFSYDKSLEKVRREVTFSIAFTETRTIIETKVVKTEVTQVVTSKPQAPSKQPEGTYKPPPPGTGVKPQKLAYVPPTTSWTYQVSAHNSIQVNTGYGQRVPTTHTYNYAYKPSGSVNAVYRVQSTSAYQVKTPTTTVYAKYPTYGSTSSVYQQKPTYVYGQAQQPSYAYPQAQKPTYVYGQTQTPSYTYTQAQKPTYVYGQTSQTYVVKTGGWPSSGSPGTPYSTSYKPAQTTYVQPKRVYTQASTTYVQQKPVYAQTSYVQQKPVYTQAQTTYVQQKPLSAQTTYVQPTYTQSQTTYVQQKPVYGQTTYVQQKPVVYAQQSAPVYGSSSTSSTSHTSYSSTTTTTVSKTTHYGTRVWGSSTSSSSSSSSSSKGGVGLGLKVGGILGSFKISGRGVQMG